MKQVLLVGACTFLGCGSAADSVALERLPLVVPDPGPPKFAARAPNDDVYVMVPAGGQVLRKGTNAWMPTSEPVPTFLIRDFYKRTVMAIAAPGVVEINATGIVQTEPPVPPPPVQGGYSAIRGRDSSGFLVFWDAAYVDAQSASLFVGKWLPGQATWEVATMPLPLTHSLPSGGVVLAGDGTLFYRPAKTGIWKVDGVAKEVKEVIPCAHSLFRPSHPDYQACQQDTLLFSGANGEVFAMNAMFEIWRIDTNSGTADLVINGDPPQLPLTDAAGFRYYAISPQKPYAAPNGRLWLAFRWGDNTADDHSYFYTAQPGNDDAWSFLRNDLPRNIQLWGAGDEPLISNASAEEPFEVFQVHYQ